MNTTFVKSIIGLLSLTAVGLAERSASATNLDWTTRNQWQWYGNGTHTVPPFPNNPPIVPVYHTLTDYNPVCMANDAEGSIDTGIGVYIPSTWNNRVMFWFDGGGFCFDAASCANPSLTPATIAADFVAGVVPAAPFTFRKSFNYTDDFLAAVNQTGGFDINLMAIQKPELGQGIFDHSNPATPNPFANYLQIFVPYCTGDLHIGGSASAPTHVDNANHLAGVARQPSGLTTAGLYNTTHAISWTMAQVQAQIGGASPLVAITGGSAGGFGSLLMYGMIRPLINASTPMVTISDSGTPYATGTPNSNGTAWSSVPSTSANQGYLAFPTLVLSTNNTRPGCSQYPNPTTDQCASPTMVTYQEAWMADAWGLTTGHFPAALVKTPAGSPGPFASMQDVLSSNITANSPPQTGHDKFYVVDGSDDFADTWFFSMYPTGQFPTGYTGTADVGHGQSQIISKFGTTVFHQIMVDGSGIGTLAGAIPWYKHHGFLLDDTSTWVNQLFGGTGSGIAAYLASITPAL
ncbi:MAG TPA: hypothetical protein VK762_30635 [Polyangiaceae bacterium]|nr:hypothetical protein [Polyangiaceae bacterium]